MELLFLSVLSSIVLSVQGQGSGCDQYCDACTDVADIAKITCDPSRGTCNIVKGDNSNEENLDDLLAGITTIDAVLCRQKCIEQVGRQDNAENQCKFYLWEEGHQDRKTNCSLQTTCNGPNSYCGKPACKSGQLGCSDDCKQVTPCHLTQTVWDHNKFHVICTDKEKGDVNIYSPDIANQDINDGTICSTIRMCDEWSAEEVTEEDTYYRRLAIVCDGVGGDGVAAGQWKILEKTGSDALSEAMKGDSTQIVEQECTSKCVDLGPLTQIDYDWVDLICEATLEEKTLKEPNSCIMLCDNHLKMTIDCDYKENGEKKWQDSHGVVLTDASIKC